MPSSSWPLPLSSSLGMPRKISPPVRPANLQSWRIWPLGDLSWISRSRSHECSMFTHTDWMLLTAVIVCVAPKPVKLSFDVYDAWHSASTQLGVDAPHVVDVVHDAPLLRPSGSSMPLPTGCWTMPHTGHGPMP